MSFGRAGAAWASGSEAAAARKVRRVMPFENIRVIGCGQAREAGDMASVPNADEPELDRKGNFTAEARRHGDKRGERQRENLRERRERRFSGGRGTGAFRADQGSAPLAGQEEFSSRPLRALRKTRREAKPKPESAEVAESAEKATPDGVEGCCRFQVRDTLESSVDTSGGRTRRRERLWRRKLRGGEERRLKAGGSQDWLAG
ncbi:hypothetical protein SBA4_980002 [Candidatus Sulfopaludibacter sp. SbA4]|nr:hypothetical protein SBA4_980002 [Candidatus Sulfopaludibacter sp. SbA4]